MESVETIIPKLDQAGEFFWHLGIRSNADANRYGNVKLMKLLYIFYLKYIQLYVQKNNALPAPADPFSKFRFYAWPYGPVETSVYDSIGVVRYKLENNFPHYNDDWQYFNNANLDLLHQAFEYVAQYFQNRSVNDLIEFTHNTLYKWRRTPMYGEMKFFGIEDFEAEYNRLVN